MVRRNLDGWPQRRWMPVEIGLQPGIEEYAQFQLPAGLIARQ
ncbi:MULTISPECIES: hypothetical protein [Pseudomonas aeruginosa group]|nr:MULTISPECIES: hypothetical protein [Pseudomonas aeruginosa group]